MMTNGLANMSAIAGILLECPRTKMSEEKPARPQYRNCIRCLTQYKITTAYDDCQRIVRDFCDNCIGDLTYEQMEDFAMEIPPTEITSSGEIK